MARRSFRKMRGSLPWGTCFVSSRSAKQFQQLFLNGYPLKRAEAAPGDTQLPRLEPLQWALVDGRIYFCVEPGQLPQDYLLTYAKLSVGITVYKADDVLIHNLTVQGFQLDGVNFHDATGPCRLIDVTAK